MTRREHVWRCTCGASHFVSIGQNLYSDGTRDSHLMVEDAMIDFGWWHRLKAAWHLFWKRRHTWCEILLDDGTVIQMIAELEACQRGEGVVRP